MKSFFVAILAMSLLLCSLVSCGHTQTASSEAATFDSLVIDTVCPLFKNYEKPACHIHVMMQVPVDPTEADTKKAIERLISSLPKDGAFEEESSGSVETMCQAYVRSYVMDYLNAGHDAIDNYGDDIEAAATWMSYEENVEGSVIFNQDGFVSYQVCTYSYTGGAHGNTSVDNGVVNLNTGAPVSLDDLFNDASMTEVNNLIHQKLVQQYECQTLEELVGKGLFFSPTEIEASENFYFDQNGITWMYDPYEIAPYSTGEVSVTLSWDEVYAYLTQESPALDLAKKYSNGK